MEIFEWLLAATGWSIARIVHKGNWESPKKWLSMEVVNAGPVHNLQCWLYMILVGSSCSSLGHWWGWEVGGWEEGKRWRERSAGRRGERDTRGLVGEWITFIKKTKIHFFKNILCDKLIYDFLLTFYIHLITFGVYLINSYQIILLIITCQIIFSHKIIFSIKLFWKFIF